ncbi:MAG TPA: ATP synthase F1 subunit epsilon [Bacteroidales bacterium]|nr:ATP synthase F1 subunit epsilon [Bacteroidales bacterium]
MYLEIVTPVKTVYSDEVLSVTVPGTKGSFGMLKNHAPIVSTLATGEIKITDKNNQKIVFKVSGGVVENTHNNVVILADSIEKM